MNCRIFILALVLVLSCAWFAWSQEGQDWRTWQELYHQNRAERAESPEQAEQWKNRPIEIKQVEVNFSSGAVREVCITCHDGIEPMSPSHPESMGCTVCHGGDPEALEKDAAHATLIHDPRAGTGRRNPSALSVVHLSCGRAGCHSGHADASRNHVQRVRRSMMGTLTGMIAGLRFQWAAQETRRAKYGVYSLPVPAPPEGVQEAAQQDNEIEALPFFLPRDRQRALEQGGDGGGGKVSHHPADGVLRSGCLECHLDGTPDPEHPRSQGCAACHVSYSSEGLYEGMDPTIDTKQRGHMKRHRLTALPEEATCTVCHRAQARQENRVVPAVSPATRDVHVEAGMECIDCHTSSDVMGDGTVHSRQYEAVEIQCETCHGDAEHNPRVARVEPADARVLRENRHYADTPVGQNDWVAVSRRRRKLSNVKVHEGNIVTVSKRTGKTWNVPLIKGSRSHRISGHNERLACNACHSSSVPECRGCHLTLEATKRGSLFASTEIEHREPALMIGPDGRVRPALPQPPRTLNALDAKGTPLPVIDDWGDKQGRYREFVFTNPLGYSGANPAYATHPHATGRQVRGCASCHLSAAALGLGEAILEMGQKSSGKKDRAETVQRGNVYGTLGAGARPPMATPQGQPVAGTHQPGARPFNQKELNRILRVGNCLPCHAKEDDPIYRDIDKSYRTAEGARHRALVKQARGAL